MRLDLDPTYWGNIGQGQMLKIMFAYGEDECWPNKYSCWKHGYQLHSVTLNALSLIINCAKYSAVTWHFTMCHGNIHCNGNKDVFTMEIS